MKCDELKAYKGDVTIPVYGTIADAKVYLKKDVDAAIAELKHTIDELVVVKKSAELILQNLLDCGLIKEWYFNGKFNAVLKADDPHLKIAELKQKLESVQASMYCDVVDANMEIRRLKRALWLARAEWARSSALSYHLIESHPDKDVAATYKRKANKWEKAKDKCLKKSKEYL